MTKLCGCIMCHMLCTYEFHDPVIHRLTREISEILKKRTQQFEGSRQFQIFVSVGLVSW